MKITRRKVFEIINITILIVILFALFSCVEPLESDDEVMPYVEEYIQEALDRNVDIEGDFRIVLGNTPDSTKAVHIGGGVIIYNWEHFYQDNKFERLRVISHELGHALFNMKHGDNMIMTSDYFYYELFQREAGRELMFNEYFNIHNQGSFSN